MAKITKPQQLELDRVEIKHVKYDKKGRAIEETWEFWYPPEKISKPMGYTIK